MIARALVAMSLLILLAGCSSQPVAVGSASPSPSGQVIPWTPLQPNLTPPSPTSGPAPIPPGTPPCQAADLAGAVIGSQGATGHVVTSFGIAGAGGAPCYLDGTPSLGLVDSKGHSVPFRQQAPYFPPLHPGRALIQPGPVPSPHTELVVGQAELTIDWVSQPEACPGTEPVVPAQALIAIPAGGILAVAIPPEPAAYPCAGLGVGVFEGPYVLIQPSPPPPLPAIALQVPSTARVGHDLPYLVTLTNDGGQTLDLAASCPTYEEELFADIVHGSPPLGGKHIYALNCGSVGVLKPGASVTFQMVFLRIPPDSAPGSYTLVFMLGHYNAMTSFAQAPVTITQ